jgi:hypothetical protein
MKDGLRRELRSLGQTHPNLANELHGKFTSDERGGQAENEDGFTYGVFFGAALAAGAQNSQPLVIDSQSAFRLEQITGYAEPNGQAAPIYDSWVPQLKLNLFDGTARRSLFSIDLPWGAVVGTSRLPFIPAIRRVFSPNQTLSLTVTNFSAIQYNNVYIALIGANLYVPRGMDGG